MDLKRILNNYEVKNATWIIGGRIVQMLMSLVVGVLSARYLGPSNYGLINYGNTFVSFFAALCNLGLNAVIIKDFLDNPDEQGEAIGSAIALRVLSSLVTVLLILGVVSILDKDEPMTIMVVALCSIGAVFHSFDIFRYWFQFRYESKIPSMATVAAYMVMSVYKIILLIYQKNVLWFAIATSLDYIVVAVMLYVSYKRKKGARLFASVKKSKSLLKSSHHYIWSSLMVSVYGQTDKIMLKQFLNETEVGFYAVAVGVCSMWTFVLQAIIDSVYPTILKLRDEDYQAYERKNRQLYAVVFYVSLIVSILICLLGNIIIGLLYGESYLPAVAALRIITWYTAFSYLGVARNAWIVSEGKQRYLKYMYGGAVVINIILNVLFIPLIGAAGAALASLITQMFTSVVLPMFFKDIRPNAKLMVEAILLQKLK